MIEFPLAPIRRVLCVGAHSDDLEIGCGGTLMKLAREKPDVCVNWVVFSGGGGPREEEARASAQMFLRGFAHAAVSVEHFTDGFFPHDWKAIKESFERLKAFDPDLVLTHYRDDRHQDHRVLSDLAWNTFRRHLILEYEIPKYDGDMGAPNVFVRLDEEICRAKADLACRFFASQSDKHWFTPDTFLGLMRLRGMECVSPTGYAEAFYCRKLVLE